MGAETKGYEPSEEDEKSDYSVATKEIVRDFQERADVSHLSTGELEQMRQNLESGPSIESKKRTMNREEREVHGWVCDELGKRYHEQGEQIEQNKKEIAEKTTEELRKIVNDFILVPYKEMNSRDEEILLRAQQAQSELNKREYDARYNK